MNTIAQRQNEDDIMALLAAQRQVYTEAKWLVSWRFIFSLALALFPLLLYGIPYLAEYEWSFIVPGILISFLFPFVLQKWEQKKVGLAAAIQEKIDTTLFALPWGEKGELSEPLQEQVEQADKRFKGKREDLRDWYGGIPAELPRETAVLRCQKTNLWWDAEQRQYYIKIFLGMGVAAIIVPFVWAGIYDVNMREFLAKVFLPVLPLAQLCAEKIMANWNLTRIQEEKATEINNLLAENVPVSDTILRANQDVIFQNRRETALVPDWLYNRQRRILEPIMQDLSKQS